MKGNFGERSKVVIKNIFKRKSILPNSSYKIALHCSCLSTENTQPRLINGKYAPTNTPGYFYPSFDFPRLSIISEIEARNDDRISATTTNSVEIIDLIRLATTSCSWVSILA
jgi:hypothetical protein